MMRQTYRQEWHEYNLSQTNEKSRFLELLFSLCDGIREPVQTFGRPRLSFAEMIFCCCFKVYSTVSGRRFMSDLRDAMQKGYISKVPHFNSVSNYLESEQMTAYLKELIIESGRPLAAVESDFAADSSGFSTGIYQRWFDAKWKKPSDAGYGSNRKGIVRQQDWVKVHIMCGVKTNVITAIEITHAHSNDSPQFAPLVETTSRNFQIREVSADRAYTSASNMFLVMSKGGTPYIPFKKNTNVDRTYDKRQPIFWKKMYHQYMANQDEFWQHYHKRSNVECTFSMVKRKFGERLRSKTKVAQTNEVLCKILAHNLCCLIQSIYELGIEPTFWTE